VVTDPIGGGFPSFLEQKEAIRSRMTLQRLRRGSMYAAYYQEDHSERSGNPTTNLQAAYDKQGVKRIKRPIHQKRRERREEEGNKPEGRQVKLKTLKEKGTEVYRIRTRYVTRRGL